MPATGDVNWGFIIASGILVGLLILALIAGLYLLLNPPPVSEPLGTPDGMLACIRATGIAAAGLGPAAKDTGEAGSSEMAG